MTVATLMAQATGDASDSNISSYDGPSVMGRGPLRIGLFGAEAVPIRFTFDVGASYDSLLGGFRTDGNGNLAPASGSYGVQGGFSVSGQKRYRRSVFGISYSGSYNYIANVDGFSGANQALSLGYSRRLARRLEMSWTTTGSITNRLLGNPLTQQSVGADLVTSPVNELFDNRLFFLQSQMQLAYRLSSRWYVQGGANGGTVRRQAASLADVNIYGASASLLYRWDRNTTLGFGYNFSHFNFGRFFGESNLHGLTVDFGRRIGRDWQLNLSATGQNVRTIGVRRVGLDPVIAALLGTSTGVEAFDATTKIAGYGVGVERRYRRSRFTARADRSAVPGNGLMLTSVVNTQSLGFSTNVTRGWSIHGGGSRSSMSEVAGTNYGAFNVWQMQAGANRRLTTEIGLTTSIEYRSFKLGNSTLDRRGSRFMIGLTYTPNTLPFGR